MQRLGLDSSTPGTAPRNSDGTVNQHSLGARPANAVIYCRVSSKEQIEGTSLESQEIACKEYARAHEITVERVFVERGESAKFADRTQLIQLIDFCRNSKTKIDALIVWKLDRFARNVGDHFNIKATLMKYGVRVVSVTEPIDTNPEGKLMETILAGFAQFDNDIRAARTVQGMRRKIEEGISPWSPPLGYKSAQRNGGKKTKPDEPDQPLFGLLQKAWKEFASGTHTKADMRRLMDSWGVQTAEGVPMTAQSLDNFFQNPYYVGILTDPWARQQYAGLHVPMVSPEDFARVQTLIRRRNRSIPHQKERVEFPLRGAARCSMCRQYLTGALSTGRIKRYPYYICHNRGCDSQPNYRAEMIHEEFATLLERIAPKPEVFRALGKRVLMGAQSRQVESTVGRKRKDAELARLEKQIQELIRMRTEQLITDDQFIALKTTISKRQVALAGMGSAELFDAKEIETDLHEIEGRLTQMKATWNSVPVGFHRRFNHMVLPVGFVVGESRTANLGPIFKAFEGYDGPNSHGVALTGERSNQLFQAIQAFAELFRDLGEQKKAA